MKKSTVPFLLLSLFVLLFYCANTAVFGNEESLPLEVTATVDRETIYIGDTITYTLAVKVPKDIKIEFPTFGANLADFAVTDFGERKKGLFGVKTHEKWFTLDTYVTGEYTIPPAIIRYRQSDEDTWQEFQTEEITITVESILQTADDVTDIRDIKEPLAIPFAVNPLVIGVVVVLLLAGGMSIWLFRRGRQAQARLQPKRPAHEIAYEALAALKEKHYIEHGEIKEYYVALSLIVRQYIENRFNVRAPEMTTEEFLVSIKDARVLAHAHKSVLKDFLEECDMVKFAKYGPTVDEITKSLGAAERLIDQTKKVVGK